MKTDRRKLNKYDKRDIIDQNEARLQANLSLLKIKVYTCMVCSLDFESVGDRTCKVCKYNQGRLINP